MTRRRLLVVLVLLLVADAGLEAQRRLMIWRIRRPASSDPLPAARKYDWTYTGIPGGIPTSRVTCQTLSSGSSAATVNTALSNCASAHTADAGGVVVLSAGSYSFAGTSITLQPNTTLRGAGPQSTTLTFSSGFAVTMPDIAGTTLNTAITAGGSQGSFSFTVASTTSLSVGLVIMIDRANDAALFDANWVSADAAGRGIAQMNAITAINGSVVTVRNPLMYDFGSGTPKVAQVYPNYNKRIGLEDVHIDYGGSGAASYWWRCDSCWALRINAGNSTSYTFTLYGGLNEEVRDSFFHDGVGSNNNGGLRTYGDYLNNGTGTVSNLLAVNNIFNMEFPAIELNANQTSAVLYNFVYGGNGGGTNGVSWTIDDGHAPVDMYNLFEGNSAEMVGADGYFGSNLLGTFFRNNITGYNPIFSAGGDAVWLKRIAYYYNFVGNVLGSTLQAPTLYDTSCQDSGNGIYSFGYPDLGNCGTSPHDAITVTGGYPDARVASTVFRWGNYDFKNNATRFVSGEVPTATSPASMRVTVPSTQTLANSYYYSAKPSFFGSVAWPPHGPDVLGGALGAGHASKIPAQLCSELQSLPSGGTFNPSACYPAP